MHTLEDRVGNGRDDIFSDVAVKPQKRQQAHRKVRGIYFQPVCGSSFIPVPLEWPDAATMLHKHPTNLELFVTDEVATVEPYAKRVVELRE